jgi:hypothetical protein
MKKTGGGGGGWEAGRHRKPQEKQASLSPLVNPFRRVWRSSEVRVDACVLSLQRVPHPEGQRRAQHVDHLPFVVFQGPLAHLE